MNDWLQLKSEILDYIDGQLSAEKKKRVALAIEQNSEAREFFTNMKALRQQLSGLTPIRTSTDFDTVLRARIMMEKSMSRRSLLKQPFSMPVVVTAGALALFVLFAAPRLFQTPQLNSASSGQEKSINVPLNSAPYVGKRTTQSVHYPMDFVRLSQGGTQLNSNSLQQRADRADSLRSNQPDRSLMTVEF